MSCLALVAAAALAAAAGGCSHVGAALETSDQAFTKPFIETPEWAKSSNAKTAPLAPSGPVAPEDLVDAGGRCSAAARAQAPVAAAPAGPEPAATPAASAPATSPSYSSVAGDLAGARMPAGPPPTPMPVAVRPSDRLDTLQPDGGGSRPAIGGIALGMTECEAVRRGGQPSNVTIGAGDQGARKVVLTYLSGPWPGIYTFASGRLQEIDAAPVQAKPAKPAPKKKLKLAPPKTATSERVYVQ